MNGYLYIISNSNFENWIKVGVTKDLKSRLQTYQTASPHRNYILEYSVFHPDYLIAEKKVKDMLQPFAKSIKNEWFEISLSMAKPRLDEVLDEYVNKKN
jgi:predicted GIY-YIG superfamily endonuclease